VIAPASIVQAVPVDDQPFDPDCPLCRAERYTEWFFEDDVCWIAECESCSVPMVVWKCHDPNPSEEVRVVLAERLGVVARGSFGDDWWIDDVLRTIPSHYHAHARPRRW
jgi:hypothetical protein